MPERIVKTPSPKQLELLRQLYRFRRRHGYAPTLEELGKILGVAKVTVHQTIRTLERKGLVSRLRHRARSLEITDDGKLLHLFEERPCEWILAGNLYAAGKLRFLSPPRKIEPDLLVQRYKHVSLLKVSGRPPGHPEVCDGDYLLIEPLRDKHIRQLALVQRPGGKVELHQFVRKERLLYIQDITDKTILTPIRHADILGIVVGLLRTY